MIIFNHKDDPQMEVNLIDYMYLRNVDDLILSLISDVSRLLGKIAQRHTPIIIFDRETKEEYSQSVLLNNNQTRVLAGKHLAILGHKNIACITGPQSIEQCRDRLSGFSETLDKYGISIPTSIRNMRVIICCCDVFARSAKTSQQQVFLPYLEGKFQFRIDVKPLVIECHRTFL